MAWLITKEDYKVGERYTSFLIYWFGFHLLMRAFAGKFSESVNTSAANLMDWTGMPIGLAEILSILIIGTLTFPPVLLLELWHLHSKRKWALPDDPNRKTNKLAFHLGRLVGWILSKRKRS